MSSSKLNIANVNRDIEFANDPIYCPLCGECTIDGEGEKVETGCVHTEFVYCCSANDFTYTSDDFQRGYLQEVQNLGEEELLQKLSELSSIPHVLILNVRTHGFSCGGPISQSTLICYNCGV